VQGNKATRYTHPIQKHGWVENAHQKSFEKITCISFGAVDVLVVQFDFFKEVIKAYSEEDNTANNTNWYFITIFNLDKRRTVNG
jgi:hypothetical protein